MLHKPLQRNALEADLRVPEPIIVSNGFVTSCSGTVFLGRTGDAVEDIVGIRLFKLEGK